MRLAPAKANNSELAKADNGFGFKLLKQLVHDQPAQNIFISPYSASTVLQMVGNGAAGQTKKEMKQVLEMEHLSQAEVNAANKSVAQILNGLDTNVVLLSANNAIWYRPGIVVNPDFVACNREFFDATVGPLDFGDPHAIGVIDQWASDNTHGKISRIADRIIDPRDTTLFLANAVYFNGKWAEPFKVRATRDLPFYLSDGSHKTIPMMTKTRTFSYMRGAGFQAVKLPYRDESLSMYVFLPEPGSGPEQILTSMSGEAWQRVINSGLNEEQGTLVLPKFKFDYTVPLEQPLEALGMKTAFDRSRADFSGIAPQRLCISAVLQKAFVEVKEEGTEAAAVTAIGVGAEAIEMPPPNSFEMIVDRPFWFLIKDNQTGIILFMGVLFDPQAD